MARSAPEIDQLPTGPGVYVFKDAAGTVIYVGKAVNLRSRVRQYFSLADERPTVRFLVERIRQVDTTVTDNEAEALLLENTLIKKHQPRYNIQLRDDKDYVSLRINAGHEWPMVNVIRRPQPEPGSLTFGPYSSAGAVRETLRFLRRTFPLRTCRDTTLYNRTRPCLEYQIGRCVAPCVGYVTQEEYRRLQDQVVLFLKGRNTELRGQLDDEMRIAAAKEEFEKAAKLRDRLRAVERVLEEQKVDSHDESDRDVFGFYREADRGAVSVLSVRGGRLVENRTFLFDESAEEDAELLTNFVVQYYAEREVPPEVLLAKDLPEEAALAEVLEQARHAKVVLRTPQRGAKKDLVAMAGTNAESAFRRTHDRETGVRRDLESLSRALDLVGPPQRLECVDLSMIQAGSPPAGGSLARKGPHGRAPVGAVVTFIDGQPSKELYRRFHIKDLAAIAQAGQELSDFAMMKEVLSRRFARAGVPRSVGRSASLRASDSPLASGSVVDPASAEGPWALPDLMVVDGGKAQLQVAEAVLVELGITGLPLCAIAKDPEHGKAKGPSEERVFVPGRANPVSFQREKGGMFLLQRIRDEAHRFAITFHRKTRNRATLRSALDSIPGIGDTRRKALLRHFGSAKKVAAATLDELVEAPAMSRSAAEAVYRWFHKGGGEAEPDSGPEGQA